MTEHIHTISVDDDESNLLLIEAMAKEMDLSIHSFADPLESLQYMKENTIDLAFIDYQMPGMNGIDLIRHMRDLHPEAPIIMITSVNTDNSLRLRAIEAGATEFLNKPLNMPEFRARVSNLVDLRMMNMLLKDRAMLLKIEVRKATDKIISRERETLEILGRVADYNDLETGSHITRVAHYANILAVSIGETEEFRDVIFNASPLHDIGKVGIPDTILRKEGPLSEEEQVLMRAHPLIGYNILKSADSSYLRSGAVISLHHHERFDGSGYPAGLKGVDISLMGRITAMCDVFDALMTKRPYKSAWSLEHVIEYFETGRATHFDPMLVDHFIKNIDAFVNIFTSFGDSEP
ncbi:MAG: two-component system response regulator [Spirochaetae bacterium HGW-Spirochaetae-1]|jgi:response regulator RpfG family c-di-GMP phosphodiesterase|nr:MAG: two-component system response regulator [Spirochaetae bacterium HGW-Spirochaetae-1]